MSLAVYVAAPYADAPFVRVLHERLESLGMITRSRWADHANGAPEDFGKLTPSQILRALAQNDADLSAADVVLVLGREGAGGEMFAEARVALEWDKAVVWCGRRTLSAWRPGVVRAEDLDDAVAILAAMNVAHAEGYRGQLLTHLVEVRT